MVPSGGRPAIKFHHEQGAYKAAARYAVNQCHIPSVPSKSEPAQTSPPPLSTSHKVFMRVGDTAKIPQRAVQRTGRGWD